MPFKRLTKGVQNPESVVILLHGYGSDERDLMGLADSFPSRFEIVSLRAPRECPFGGYAWFDIDFAAEKKLNEDQAVLALDALIPELESIASEHPGAKMILGGFSQGAMMTFGVLNIRPDLFAAAMMMSGLPLASFGTKSLEGKRIIIQHGTFDEIVPVAGGRALRDRCVDSNAQVQYLEYPMGHTVTPESLDDLVAWLQEA